MGKDYLIPVAVVAIDKAFKQSNLEGIVQVGREIKNLVTRTQEIVNPLGAYFATPLEVRTNKTYGVPEIFWEGYERSIGASLRRNAALLRLNHVPKEEYEKAKAEWKTWQALEQKALNLNEGEGIQFLALRQQQADQGVSLQQLSVRNGQLLLESQLLPFDQISQIENLQQLFVDRGEDISLTPENGSVDTAVGWAVQGQAIDFKQDLPKMIEQVNQLANFSETFPVIPVSRQNIPVVELPINRFIDSHHLTDSVETRPDVPIATSEAFSFWYMATGITQNIETAPEPEYFEAEDNFFPELITSGSEPEVMPVFVEEGKIEAAVSSAELNPADELEPVLTQEPTRIVPAGELTLLYSDRRIKTLKKETLDDQKREIVTRPQYHSAAKKKESIKPQTLSRVFEVKIVFRSQTKRRKERQKERVIKVATDTQSPIYELPQLNLWQNVFNANEIPVWQINLAVSANENEAMILLAVTTLFLLANTKWLRLVEGSEAKPLRKIAFKPAKF